MARIIYMLGVLALTSAGLLLALCATDERRCASATDASAIDSVVDRFRQADSGATQDSEHRLSPLIRQAQAFALYLNPPAPPQRDSARTERATPEPVAMLEVRPANASPKFELRGISYHRSKPERSMALVWEPGRGNRWVKQGSQLGHAVIKQIKSDSIVYQDAAGERAMAFLQAQPSAQYAQASGERPFTAETAVAREPLSPPADRSSSPRTDARAVSVPTPRARVASARGSLNSAEAYRQTIAEQNRRRYEKSVRMGRRMW